MTIVFFFIRIHQFTLLFSRRHQPFIQDTTKKTNSVCCVQFKNNNECTYHVWRLLVSHHCLPSNNVPSSFVLCDENTIWWTFFTNVWIWGHTGKALELIRLDRTILEDAFLGQRFNSGMLYPLITILYVVNRGNPLQAVAASSTWNGRILPLPSSLSLLTHWKLSRRLLSSDEQV